MDPRHPGEILLQLTLFVPVHERSGNDAGLDGMDFPSHLAQGQLLEVDEGIWIDDTCPLPAGSIATRHGPLGCQTSSTLEFDGARVVGEDREGNILEADDRIQHVVGVGVPSLRQDTSFHWVVRYQEGYSPCGTNDSEMGEVDDFGRIPTLLPEVDVGRQDDAEQDQTLYLGKYDPLAAVQAYPPCVDHEILHHGRRQ